MDYSNSLSLKSSQKLLCEDFQENDELSVHLFVAEVKKYPIHMHKALEIIYVLEGSLNLRSSIDSTYLPEGHLYIVNSGDLHEMQADQNAIVLFTHISLEAYLDYAPNLNKMIFASEFSNDNNIKSVKNLILNIFYGLLENNMNYNKDLDNSVINLILDLVNHFQFSCRNENILKNNSHFKNKKIFHMERVQRIVNFIYENYHQKISLEQLAAMEYLSKYYLTHILKTATGNSFQELLTLVRVEESEKLLLGTSASVEEISHMCGFSSPTYYSKNFKAFFKDTPSSYREKNKPAIIGNAEKQLKVLHDEISLYEIKKILSNKNETFQNTHGLHSNSPTILTLHFSEKISEPATGCKIPKPGLYLPDVKVGLSALWQKTVSDLFSDVKIHSVVVDSTQCAEIYKFFQSWDWISPLVKFLKSYNISLIGEKKQPPLWDYKRFGSFINNLDNPLKSDLLLIDLSDLYEHQFDFCFRTPAFIELYFLSLLEGNRLISEDGYMVTAEPNGYTILLSHCNSEPTATKGFIIRLMDMDDHYLVKEYCWSAQCKDEYTLFQDLGCPLSLTEDTLKTLRRIGFPPGKLSVIEEQFFHDFYVTLEPNSCKLIKLEKVRKAT